MPKLQTRNVDGQDRDQWREERDIIPAPPGLEVILEGGQRLRIIAFDNKTGAALIMGPDGYLVTAAELAAFKKSKDVYFELSVVTTADGLVKVAEQLHEISEALWDVARHE